MGDCEPRLKILALATEYPNSTEPFKGLFIRARLQLLAQFHDVVMMAPVAIVDYAHPNSDLFAFRKLPKHYPDGPVLVEHVPWLYPPFGGFLNGFFLCCALFRSVARLRRTFPFDLISAEFAHPEGVAAALLGTLFGCPFAVTIRGNELAHCRFFGRRQVIKWVFRQSRIIIAVSPELSELASVMGGHRDKIVTIPNGVDVTTFQPRDRIECARKHGFGTSDLVVLAVGNLAPVKRQDWIIRAAAGLVRRGFPVKLIIVGGTGRSGRYEKTLRAEASSSGLGDRVQFLSELPQSILAELMAVADVFCLASSREGWPNVVNEALACGTPVVATDVGAVRQLIPSAEYGIVVPRDNAAALEAAIEAALVQEWDRPRIAVWGRSRSWAHAAHDVTKHLQTTLSKAPHHMDLIVNADDLGIAEKVNNSIFDLMSMGAITSATILANGNCVREAVQQLRHFPECSFGVHLNVTQFAPISADREVLKNLTRGGEFSREIVRGWRSSPALLRSIYVEFCAQIELLLSMGVRISHIDSHHHVHTLPHVLPVLKRIQTKYGIRKVRISKNIYNNGHRVSYLLRSQKYAYNTVLRTIYKTRTTEGFCDLLSFERASTAQLLRYRTVELMVHPGGPEAEEETRSVSERGWDRKKDLRCKLISYHSLPDCNLLTS